jgi:hypothetical protein
MPIRCPVDGARERKGHSGLGTRKQVDAERRSSLSASEQQNLDQIRLVNPMPDDISVDLALAAKILADEFSKDYRNLLTAPAPILGKH